MRTTLYKIAVVKGAGFRSIVKSRTEELPDEPIDLAIAKMKSWYIQLVKAGSLVFEFEYDSRKESGP